MKLFKKKKKFNLGEVLNNASEKFDVYISINRIPSGDILNSSFFCDLEIQNLFNKLDEINKNKMLKLLKKYYLKGVYEMGQLYIEGAI